MLNSGLNPQESTVFLDLFVSGLLTLKCFFREKYPIERRCQILRLSLYSVDGR